MSIDWSKYRTDGFYDELITPKGRARTGAGSLCRTLAQLSDDELTERRTAAELAIRSMGITFTVYTGEGSGSIDREWPFDIVPRLIMKREWDSVSAGLKQRVKALNRFIDDVYHDQRILADGVVPAEYVQRSREFRPECVGINPPHAVWSHVCGSDLVRDADGRFYVLEDNLRVPSGVSYMLENREVMKRVFPELFEEYVIYPVDDYPDRLAECLRSLSPKKSPQIAVLTPGIYNSAYFEHAYLANAMSARARAGIRSRGGP